MLKVMEQDVEQFSNTIAFTLREVNGTWNRECEGITTFRLYIIISWALGFDHLQVERKKGNRVRKCVGRGGEKKKNSIYTHLHASSVLVMQEMTMHDCIASIRSRLGAQSYRKQTNKKKVKILLARRQTINLNKNLLISLGLTRALVLFPNPVGVICGSSKVSW